MYLSNKRKETDEDIFIYNKKIKDSKSATHLGIVRNVDGKLDIEEKINLGRKTAHSLMGGGGGRFPWRRGAQTISEQVYGQLLWYLDCCMSWSQYCLVRKMSNVRKVPKEISKANTGSPGQNCQFNISCTSGDPACGCCCTQKCSYCIFKHDTTKRLN